MISIDNLVFEYPHFRALKNISCTIHEGTITALVGPNGAGKTTLFSCIAGLERPFSGSVTVKGIDVTQEPRKVHSIVGFLPDFFGLYDGLTIRKSLAYFGSYHYGNQSELDKAVLQTAERLNLTDKLDSGVGELSRGMRQRLAIGQSLMGKPEVLLLDEPASGLDPGARFRLGELFKQLKAEGLTLIVSSHILSELEQYADELLILQEGSLVSHTATESEERSTTQRLSLGVVGDVTQLRETLVDRDIEILREDKSELMIRIEGGDAEAAALLRDLVTGGIEICTFAPQREDMQQRYMALLGEEAQHA